VDHFEHRHGLLLRMRPVNDSVGSAGRHGFASHSSDRPLEYLAQQLGSPTDPTVRQRVAELRAQGWQLTFALFTRQFWLF
jgi:hypothetical protein